MISNNPKSNERRERIAIAAMAAIIAKMPAQTVDASTDDCATERAVARGAVDYADALMAELEA